MTSPNKGNKVWDGKKKNASKAKAEYAEIQSIANSIPFIMVEPIFRGYEVKGQGSCQAKKKAKNGQFRALQQPFARPLPSRSEG
ncbi:conserved hypothetical protein [Ricinus communis]|uniref:Uncharacterized protein n=1 Tax=Ricinus communis TaxID=3988 RepID=B9RSA1_RICCO|nr:conserved hypothetical protein [Ricinus communis]